MKTQETNNYGAKLNLRGKMRQSGVKTLDYLKVNGKQNMIIIGATVVLFLLFTLINPNYAKQDNISTMIKSFAPYALRNIRNRNRRNRPFDRYCNVCVFRSRRRDM